MGIIDIEFASDSVDENLLHELLPTLSFNYLKVWRFQLSQIIGQIVDDAGATIRLV